MKVFEENKGNRSSNSDPNMKGTTSQSDYSNFGFDYPTLHMGKSKLVGKTGFPST